MHDRIDDCLTVYTASRRPDLASRFTNSSIDELNSAEFACIDSAERSPGVSGTASELISRARSYGLDLPDRAGVETRIGTAIAEAAGSGKPYSILWVDFDGFEGLNGISGNALRHIAADRLRIAARGSFLGRIGRDAFTIIVENERQPIASERIVDHLLGAFDGPISMDGRLFEAGLRIGIAIHPNDGRFLADAKAAM